MTTTMTAHQAQTVLESLTNAAADFIDQLDKMIAQADQIDDGRTATATAARAAEVPTATANQHAERVSNSAADIAGHLRRAREAAATLRTRVRRLDDVCDAARHGRL